MSHSLSHTHTHTHTDHLRGQMWERHTSLQFPWQLCVAWALVSPLRQASLC